MPVKCFLLEESGKLNRYLRRYHSNCTAAWRFQNGLYFLDTIDYPGHKYISSEVEAHVPHDDPRWPIQCDCGHAYQERDAWQTFTETLYKRSDTGEITTIREAPSGAMWNAWWMADIYHGNDGLCIVAKCPGEIEWIIDGRASNCNMRDKPHNCWIREGVPPHITVTKGKKGESCNVGGGSIKTSNYHGFIRNGFFT